MWYSTYIACLGLLAPCPSFEALLFKRARLWQRQRPRLVMDITGQVWSGLLCREMY